MEYLTSTLQSTFNGSLFGFKRKKEGETYENSLQRYLFNSIEYDIKYDQEKEIKDEFQRPGKYELKCTATHGEISFKIELKNKDEKVFKRETKIITAHSSRKCLELEYNIEKEEMPCTITLNFKGRRRIKPSAYCIKMEGHFTEGQTQQHKKLTKSNQFSWGIKIKNDQITKKITITHTTTYDTLRKRIEDYFGEDQLMKYFDGNEWINMFDEDDFEQCINDFKKLESFERCLLVYADGNELSFSIPNSPLALDSVSSSGGTPRSLLSLSANDDEEERDITRWQNFKKIGQGAFGDVFLVFSNDGKLIAMKEINCKGLKPDSEEMKELEKEITLLKKFSHEHIVPYYGMQRSKSKIYLFMKYIPGGSIQYIQSMSVALTELVVQNYIHQILKGLEYLHSQNIIHQDIKPANILLDCSGKVYLADFGCAQNLQKMNKNRLVGSPGYMAPEVLFFNDKTTKGDIWSLGCMMLEMLTQKQPYSKNMNAFHSVVEFITWMKHSNYQLADDIPSTLSDHCQNFIRICLNPNKDERPSAAELLAHPFIVNRIIEDDESPLDIQKIPHIDPEYSMDSNETTFADLLTNTTSDDDLAESLDYVIINTFDDDDGDDDDDIERQILELHQVVPVEPHSLSTLPKRFSDFVSRTLQSDTFSISSITSLFKSQHPEKEKTSPLTTDIQSILANKAYTQTASLMGENVDEENPKTNIKVWKKIFKSM